jgi:lipopolysaccharide transport system permease protein
VASIQSSLRYAELVRMLAQREFTGRYRGNLFGASATLIVPVLFLLVYHFVFSVLIPVEIRPGQRDAHYGFFLFAGLVGWNLFAETAGRAPRLYAQNANMLRSSLMPLSVLPVASACASLVTGMLWIFAFVAMRAVSGGNLSASVLAAPIALLGIAALAAGSSLALAAIGSLLRDLSELIQPALGLGFFLSPIVYPASKLAEHSAWLLGLNPMAGLIETLRATLLGDVWPAPELLLSALLWPLVVLGVGLAVHARVAPQLADRL